MKRLRGILALIGLGMLLAISGNALADAGGPDDFGYTYADSSEIGVTFEWTDISGDPAAVALDFIDDDNSDAIALPFPFTFYGVAYNNVYIHSNGFVKFDAETFTSYQGDQCPLPFNDAVNGVIAFYYRDHNPAEGGTVHYLIDTTSVPQRFIVQFTDVSVCCAADPPADYPAPVSVQLVMYDTNEMQVNVLDPGPAEGGDATIGIEAPGAISGLSYRGCLLSGSVVANTAVKFTPPAAGTPALPKSIKHWGLPGATLTYNYILFNTGAASVDFTLAASGSAWSPVLSATSLTLAGGTSSPFTVDVTIPGTAAGGDADSATIMITPDTGTPQTVTAVSVVQDAEGAWQVLPDAPLGLESAAGAATDGYVFVSGGARQDEVSGNFILETAVNRYEVAANMWTGVSEMPGPRSNHASCGMDGKVYVIGGYAVTGTDPQLAGDIYIYDIAADTWDTGTYGMAAIVDHAAVCDATGDRIFVMGGIINTTGTGLTGAQLSDKLYIYDAAGDSWSEGVPMNGHHTNFVAGMPVTGTIIVAGGYLDGFMYPTAEKYTVSSETWEFIDNTTAIRLGPAAGVIDPGKFCLAGGFNYTAPDGREDTYECFEDPYWIPQIASLNVPRNNIASASLDGFLYAVTGTFWDATATPPGLGLSADAERYPSAPLPDPTVEEAVEPVPDAETDAEVTPDGPTDVTPDRDAVTDVRTDDAAQDVAEEEGEEPEEGGCGCELIG